MSPLSFPHPFFLLSLFCHSLLYTQILDCLRQRNEEINLHMLCDVFCSQQILIFFQPLSVHYSCICRKQINYEATAMDRELYANRCTHLFLESQNLSPSHPTFHKKMGIVIIECSFAHAFTLRYFEWLYGISQSSNF